MDKDEIKATLDSPEFQQSVFSQFMDIFITPEVIKRQHSGQLEKPLNLTRAQIIFFPDERQTEVRINSEVKALIKVKVKPEVDVKTGDDVSENQIEEILELSLTEDDDPDCGYVIVLKLGSSWTVAFNFNYNKALSKKHINAAVEFLNSAEFALKRKYWIAFTDNLFSAIELNAKAQLLSHFNELRDARNHKLVSSRYNLFAHLGNIPSKYAEVFNRLSSLRIPVRYLRDEFPLNEQEANEIFKTVSEIIEVTVAGSKP